MAAGECRRERKQPEVEEERKTVDPLMALSIDGRKLPFQATINAIFILMIICLAYIYIHITSCCFCSNVYAVTCGPMTTLDFWTI